MAYSNIEVQQTPNHRHIYLFWLYQLLECIDEAIHRASDKYEGLEMASLL